MDGFENRKIKKIVEIFGRIGNAGRGIVFSMFSILIFRLISGNEKDEEGTLGGALNQIKDTTWGRILLVVNGILLIAFGLYCLAIVRYRNFRKEAEIRNKLRKKLKKSFKKKHGMIAA